MALAAARAGADRRVVLAERQTAGRGRGGRAWQAPAGNLNFSAVLRPPAGMPGGAWSLVAGVALIDALRGAVPPAVAADLRLKWPNDVLLRGAKLAGILVDAALGPGGAEWLVIGIGANLVAAPALPDRPTAALADLGVTLAPAALAQAIAEALDRWAATPWPETRAAWLDRAHPPGTPLAVHDGDRMIRGAFAGLAEDGALLLEGGVRVVTGDVVLAGAAAAGVGG